MSRSWIIDVLKLLGAQCILLHHISIYGPIAQEIGIFYPIFMDEFSGLTRLAVPIFLVTSGYLVAKSISQMREVHFGDLLLKRYARLAPFYLLSLCMCVIAGVLLHDYLWGTWVPEVPTWGGFIAHALFLQGLLDVPSISSGVWYVAIDFQLFALTIFMAYLFSSREKIRVDNAKLKLSLALLALLSLWVFNRFESLDNWAIYFMGSYILGMLAHWAHEGVINKRLYLLVGFLGGLSVLYEPRIRIALALCISMGLFLWAQDRGEFLSHRIKSVLSLLGDSAYAVFLNHFVLILVWSSIWDYFEMEGLKSASAMVLFYWLTCVAWGFYLHLKIESHISTLQCTPLVNLLQRVGYQKATELYKAI
jgi:peptidoglycan/LPS O-acetylase OafA/YrhL